MDSNIPTVSLQTQDIACPKCGHQLNPSTETLASPVPRLLRTNCPASQLEANLISAQLEKVDIDFSRCQVLLASLTQRQQHLRQYSHLHKSVVSALRRFPPEILADIFHYGPPDFPKAYPPAQVCRFWRDVAFSTANLWTTLDLALEEGEEEMEQYMAQQWLTHGGELPISFTLESYFARTDESSHPSIKLLTEHAHRWKNVKITLSSIDMKDLCNVQSLPALESLDIGRGVDVNGYLPQVIMDSLLAAPRLNVLVLRGRVSRGVLNAPWAQLISCELNGEYNIRECYDVILNGRNLQTCAFRATLTSRTTITHCPLIIHTNLESLEIHNRQSQERLFDHLKLPKMTKFIHSGGSLDASVISLFQRSAPPLTCLELKHAGSTTDLDLIDCLQQCASLTHLTLIEGSAKGVNVRLLRRLTHFAEETTCCLVPKLESFRVSIESGFNFESFTAMIESRWRGHGRDCQAVDHEKIYQLKQATMRQSCGSYAEDAIDEDAERPPWLHLLKQFQEEDFILVSENTWGEYFPLDDLFIRYLEFE